MYQAVANIRMAVGNKARIVAALPLCHEPFQYKDVYYPFSLEYLCTCIIRSADRDDHTTLKGDRLHKASVPLTFISRLRNFHITKESLPQGTDYIQEYMTHNEKMEVPSDIRQELGRILEGIDDDRFESDGRFDAVVT